MLNENLTRMLHAVLKKILEATTHKTTSILPLTSHVTSPPCKMKTCWALLEKQGKTHKQHWTPIHRGTSVGRLAKI